MSWLARHKIVAMLALGAGGYYLWKRTQRQSCKYGDSNIVNGVCMRTGFADYVGLFNAPRDVNGNPRTNDTQPITSPSQL